jgi:GT2 family glycosyltransferase
MDKKVLIGLSTGEHIRKAEFLPYFMAFDRPANSLVVSVHGQSPAKSRNLIAEAAIENNCTHVLFLDDDMILPKDVLTRLLAHDKDVVTALYLLRTFPHYPAMFDKKYENGKCRFAFLTPEKKGLIPIVNGGLGCVLISTEVFRRLEKPWVRLAEIAKDEWCDDIGFFNRVSEAGFEIFCDLDCQVGHILSVHMWPEQTDNGWMTNYRHLTGNVRIAQNIPGVKEIADEEKLQLV